MGNEFPGVGEPIAGILWDNGMDGVTWGHSNSFPAENQQEDVHPGAIYSGVGEKWFESPVKRSHSPMNPPWVYESGVSISGMNW